MEVNASFKKQIVYGNDVRTLFSRYGQSTNRHTFQQKFHFPRGLHCPILTPQFCSHSSPFLNPNAACSDAAPFAVHFIFFAVNVESSPRWKKMCPSICFPFTL